ncbi:myb/SANT-like DNA-binding domain-containing protein 1 isoform X2 [Xiphophorus maculatus]|uniref:Myb/SANT-like DNA-binding domain-containing protein 1 n=1 Tax=Xiphophorus maculatus TaxID=8083 RepID=M4AN57_XIPMA|nr:myb/SANT-like DNA-binding domain-containing protein 1 isoform X2 [Xiphophorus maculatus]XP_027893133.1 myb/SANT-like DNA-binding domain-containing protein 1 isoform X2 [Xiphophorus couchianus]
MAVDDSFSYLMPGHSEKHRRAPNWTDGEMKALLYVWEEFHNELKTSKRNAKVYEKMSQRFFQLTGEQRFKEEIKMKITNMSFQFRRLKATANESGETPDWPYYKAIEKILSKPLENGRVNSLEFQASAAGPSTSSQSTDNPLSQSEEGVIGFLPEYTGSSDEMEIKQELDSLSSDSEHMLGSSSHPVSARKRRAKKYLSLKRKKLQVMQAMLQQHKKSSQAIEETCRELRRSMHQQNLLQVQCLQLQERMMNLLEKMIQLPSSASAVWSQSGAKDPGKP